MALTTEQRARVIGLRALGRSFQKIAEEVGVAKDSVMKCCDQEEDCVQQYRRELVEEVVESQRLLLRDRLQSLGEFANRLRTELEGRPLEPLGTPVLARMYLETLRAIQGQEPLVVKSRAECSGEGIEVEQYHDGSDLGDLKLFRKPTVQVRLIRELLRARYGEPGQMEETNAEVWHGEEAKEGTGRV